MKTHKDLDVYKLSHKLTLKIYKLTAKFPNEEKYGLVTQLRRSAYSIPMNIAEGGGRFFKKEYLQFINIARGSTAEILYQLELVRDLKFINNNDYKELTDEYTKIGKMLTNLYKTLMS